MSRDRRRFGIEFWTRLNRPWKGAVRFEHTLDGQWTWYFGFGRVWWA